MKNKIITCIILTAVILFVSVAGALAQAKSTFAGDLLVSPMPDRDYKFARMTVAFDGSIFIGRVYKEISSNYDRYEILLSMDQGQTFTLFDDKILGPNNIHYTAFDIVAAGDNIIDFKLFVARATLDDNGNAGIRLSATNAVGTETEITLAGNEFNYNPSRGWEDLALATDTKSPNGQSNPYGIALAAIKANVSDSVVIWMDSDAGASMKRVSQFGTTGFIRNISASYGSCATDNVGAVAVAWDEMIGSTTALGQTYVQFFMPNLGFSITPPTTVGSPATTRNPVICLSQSDTHSDIRTLLTVEGAPAGDTNVYAIGDTSLLNDPIELTSGTIMVDVSAGRQHQAHVAYNAAADSFLVTYYNSADQSLAFRQLVSADAVLPGDIMTTITQNYRAASTTLTEAFPRTDGLESGKAYFVWNDGDETYFDGQSIWPASVQNTSLSVSDMKLYPNPATDNITLTFTAEENDKATLSIIDISGRVLQNTATSITKGSNKIPVALNNLPSGNYTLRISGQQTNTAVMFTVQN